MDDTGRRIAETLLEALPWPEAAELVVNRINRAVHEEDAQARLHWTRVLAALIQAR